MRVLFLSHSPIWLSGLPHGFRDAGHEVRASGPLTERRLPEIIREFDPHLAFTVGWGPEHTKPNQDLIREHVKSAGVPLVYWATEDPHFTTAFTLPLIRRMQPDFVFTLSREMVETYRQLGIRAAHLDFGYHPSMHLRVPSREEYRSAIAIVANAYPNVLADAPEHYRHQSLRTLVKPLLQAGIRADLWGRGWDKMELHLGQEIPPEWIHGYLPYQEANQVYSSADIVIGLQNYTTQVTQRTYEVLGSGGVLLTSDTPAVRALFAPGRDLIVSASPDETLRLVDYYLSHPDERERIRQHCQVTVAEHSYQNRGESIVKVLQEAAILPCHM